MTMKAMQTIQTPVRIKFKVKLVIVIKICKTITGKKILLPYGIGIIHNLFTKNSSPKQ
jgi:hypothetical protein